MVQEKSALPISVILLIWLQVLLGFGAVVSGALMMISPDGKLMQLPLFFIEASPFKGFFIPGLIVHICWDLSIVCRIRIMETSRLELA